MSSPHSSGIVSARAPSSSTPTSWSWRSRRLPPRSARTGRARCEEKSVTPGARNVNRGRLPAHLERIEQVVGVESKICACCDGALHVIGEDVSERLDVVPTTFRVLVTRRPR